MREEISCFRDRYGAGVSLLGPVQTLINPSPLPSSPCPAWSKGLWDTVRLGAGFVLAGTLWLWVASPTFKSVKTSMLLRNRSARNVTLLLFPNALFELIFPPKSPLYFNSLFQIYIASFPDFLLLMALERQEGENKIMLRQSSTVSLNFKR